RACGEGLLGARHDDRADAVIRVEGGCRIRDLPGDLAVQGVQRLRPVEGDPAHPSSSFDEDRLVLGHVSAPPVAALRPLQYPRSMAIGFLSVPESDLARADVGDDPGEVAAGA